MFSTPRLFRIRIVFLLIGSMFVFILLTANLKVGHTLFKLNPEQQSSANIALQSDLSVIPETFFSLHALNLQYGASWPTISFGSWRSWDAAGTWAYVEPQRGQWDFQLLDQYIALAKQNNVEILLVLGLSPTWASARPSEDSPYRLGAASEPQRMEDWENYVRTVATRYRGQINYYEIWNEPNSERFFSGSVHQIVSLSKSAYELLKSIDPSIQVVSPAMSPCCNSFQYLSEYLAAGGGRYADIIAYHFYVAPAAPEAMLPSIKQVKSLMLAYDLVDKPLWNTETGWLIQNRDLNIEVEGEEWAGKPLSIHVASAYLARAYIISWAAGVERLYWYAWGHRSMGLTDYDGKSPKPVANAFTEVQRWLVGATLSFCKSDAEATWVCKLQREGQVTRIVWNPDGNTTMTLPKSWQVRRIKMLDGRNHRLSSNRIRVNSSPILLES